MIKGYTVQCKISSEQTANALTVELRILLNNVYAQKLLVKINAVLIFNVIALPYFWNTISLISKNLILQNLISINLYQKINRSISVMLLLLKATNLKTPISQTRPITLTPPFAVSQFY